MSQSEKKIFIIYYADTAGSFRKAALTERDFLTLGNPGVGIELKSVVTKNNFLTAWNEIVDYHMLPDPVTGHPEMNVLSVVLFIHSSHEGTFVGLEFANDGTMNPTLTKEEILALRPMSWLLDESGTIIPGPGIVLTGCRTGIDSGRGWIPAQVFSDLNKTIVYGTGGDAFFSSNAFSYVQITPADQTVYLAAYNRWTNNPFGDGSLIPPIAFQPAP